MDIKVSIITVCYNSEKTIEQTIKSICDQSYSNFEYIIVDGKSTDKTLEIVEKYRDVLGDRLRVVSEKDKGIYDAMNKGIGMATGELIGIINSDDYYENDAIEKMVSGYNDNHTNPFTVYYGGTAIIKDGKTLPLVYSDHNQLEKEMISHPSCFVTKATYEEMGVFNLKYPCVADYDLMLRYSRSGKVAFIPVKEHVANFALGGACSTTKAYIDLLNLRMDYGQISKLQGNIDILKAKLAAFMEKRGMKPISFRKKSE